MERFYVIPFVETTVDLERIQCYQISEKCGMPFDHVAAFDTLKEAVEWAKNRSDRVYLENPWRRL